MMVDRGLRQMCISDMYHLDSERNDLQGLGVPRSIRCIERPIESIYIPDLISGAQDHFMMGLLDISVHLSTDVYHLDSGHSHLQSVGVPHSIRCIERPIKLIYLLDFHQELRIIS